MERQIKKLWRGCAEVKDYDVQDCIQKEETMRIKYNGDVMTLSPSDLTEKLVSTSKTFESKVGGKDYKLYSYKWNPDK